MAASRRGTAYHPGCWSGKSSLTQLRHPAARRVSPISGRLGPARRESAPLLWAQRGGDLGFRASPPLRQAGPAVAASPLISRGGLVARLPERRSWPLSSQTRRDGRCCCPSRSPALTSWCISMRYKSRLLNQPQRLP